MLFCDLFTERPSYIGIPGFYVIEMFTPVPFFARLWPESPYFYFTFNKTQIGALSLRICGGMFVWWHC